ncbi:MAG: hypothetical protein GX237_05160 [Clostridiales bacterium]|nr:hypothetical protein [Clostridiales bacterium]
MDRFNDNKGTPTKRTGSKGDNSSQDSRFDNNTGKDNGDGGITPEILEPKPNSATPTIPTEMPAREIR